MSRSKLDFILITLKGFTMGAANVIPGVSGGTIALITGIYEELINSLKSFDKKALELLLKRSSQVIKPHKWKIPLFLL